MTHTKFSLHGSAWEACTRSVIHPHHIHEIPVQHVDAVVNFPQIFQPPPVTAAAAQESPELEESLTLNSVLELAGDFHTYRDTLRYYYLGNPGPDCDVPEAEEETMEENAVDEDQLSLQVTLVDSVKYKCQCEFSRGEDPSTSRQLEVNVATFECNYCKAVREASPIHMDVDVVQTVSTSAEEGSESICSRSRILMEVHVDQTAKSDSCERLSQAMKGEASSVDLKLVAESHTKALHINPA